MFRRKYFFKYKIYAGKENLMLPDFHVTDVEKMLITIVGYCKMMFVRPYLKLYFVILLE